MTIVVTPFVMVLGKLIGTAIANTWVNGGNDSLEKFEALSI